MVLLGRSDFPAKPSWEEWLRAHGPDDETSAKIRRLQAIEGLGSEVLVVRADVADADQMRAALERTYAQFGSLNGVIHGAGNVASSAFFGIDQADRDLCERQFQAKVRGLIVLDQLLRNRRLDFVVLLSSVSSVLAGLGYVAYSAGNVFMDAFARKHSLANGVPWVSVNWDTWEFRDASNSKADATQLAMRPEEGVEALRRILSSALPPQIVVSTGDLGARIDQWVNPRSLRGAQKAKDGSPAIFHPRPELENPYMAPRSRLERTIAEIWQETLGVAQVGVIDNFFTDLSGSSLLATQLVSKLRDRFRVELPMRRFFDGPTVAELAVVIDSQRAGDRPTQPTEGAVEQSAS